MYYVFYVDGKQGYVIWYDMKKDIWTNIKSSIGLESCVGMQLIVCNNKLFAIGIYHISTKIILKVMEINCSTNFLIYYFQHSIHRHHVIKGIQIFGSKTFLSLVFFERLNVKSKVKYDLMYYDLNNYNQSIGGTPFMKSVNLKTKGVIRKKVSCPLPLSFSLQAKI